MSEINAELQKGKEATFEVVKVSGSWVYPAAKLIDAACVAGKNVYLRMTDGSVSSLLRMVSVDDQRTAVGGTVVYSFSSVGTGLGTAKLTWDTTAGTEGWTASSSGDIIPSSASAANPLATQADIAAIGKPLVWKGPATVATLNAGITGIQPGWTYTLTDAGTLTDGDVAVDIGDEVAWTEDGEWFQVGPSLVDNSITDEKLYETIKFNVESGGGYFGRQVIEKGSSIISSLSNPNTIYEVRWDFDLNGGTLEVPNNCALKFNGGKIVNGIIDFNNCVIIAGEEQIFEDILPSDNCKLSQGVNIRWFGGVGDGVADDTEAIKAALAFGKKLYNYHGNSSFRNYEGAGVVIFAQKNNYFRITSQIEVDYTCNILGDFIILYAGEKVDGEGAINFTGAITYSIFSFSVVFAGSFNFSDGVKFAGISYGLPTKRLVMENCKISHNVKGFYRGIQIYGDGNNGSSYVTGCEFVRCHLAVCLNAFEIAQYNGSWHNSNKFIDIWHVTGSSGYTLPTGFQKSVVFDFIGDGSYWPNSLIFERINIEGHPLNSSSYYELLFCITSSNDLTSVITHWTIKDIRLENLNSDDVILESNISFDFNQLSFYGSMFGQTNKILKIKDILYKISSKLNNIHALKSDEAFVDSVSYKDLVKEVTNAGYAYRIKNNIFYQVLSGKADLTASFTPVQEDRLNRFYGIPTKAYKLNPGKKITIEFDRVGSYLDKTFLYDNSGTLIEGSNIESYVKTYASNVRVDTNGFIFNSVEGRSFIRLVNTSNSIIVVVPASDGGDYIVTSEENISYFTSDSDVTPFVGESAAIPSLSSVNRGFVFRETNSNNLFEKYLSQTGSFFWKNITPIRYTFGSSSQRPSNLNSNTDIGYLYFDSTLGLPIFWSGTKWIKSDGTDA